MKPSTGRAPTLAYPLAVAALAAALYAPTLRYPMLWDDQMMLGDPDAFGSVRSAGELLTAPYRVFISERREGQPYYRPLNLALLVAEHRAFGTSPAGYRIVHAALHVLCCLLVYALLLGLLAARTTAEPARSVRPAAAAGAALFAIAPYGVDTVLFLTSAGDQLVLAFSLVALLAGASFCRGRGVGSAVILGAASVGCVFSKENGVVLPALFAAYCAAIGVRLRSRRFGAALAVTALATAGFLAARSSLVYGTAPLRGMSSLILILGAVGKGARLALAPHPLGIETAIPPSAASPELIVGIAISLVAAVVWVLRRRRPEGFGIAWWLVSLAPSLYAVACTGHLASRYLYIPAVGVACLAALACAAWRRSAFLAVGGALAVWLLFALLRVHAWSDGFRLWSREVELNPTRASSLLAFGTTLSGRGDLVKAAAAFRRAAELSRERGDRRTEEYARSNLCEIQAARGDLDAALAECKAAVDAGGWLADTWIDLGNVHAADGAWDKALRSYQRAEERDPGGYEALTLAADAADRLGDRELALEYLDRAAEVASGSSARAAELRAKRAALAGGGPDRAPGAALSWAWLSRGNASAFVGSWERALRAYLKAAERDPASYRALVSVAGAAAALGDRATAMRYLDRAAALVAFDRAKAGDLERRRASVLAKLRDTGSGPR